MTFYLHDLTLLYVADIIHENFSACPLSECIVALCDCLTSFVYHLDFLLASHIVIPIPLIESLKIAETQPKHPAVPRLSCSYNLLPVSCTTH